MRSRIPLRHRLRHLVVFSRLLLAYNVGLSATGASALIVLSVAGLLGTPAAGSSFLGLAWWETVCEGVLIAGLLVVSVGHWLAVLVVHLAHHHEYALYRSGGWGATGLWFASWGVSALAGAALTGIGVFAC